LLFDFGGQLDTGCDVTIPVFVREDFGDSLDGALEDLVSRASMLPITTTKEIWRRLTGLQGTEESTIRIKVPSWGEEVSLVGASVKGILTIGTLQVWNPIASFESTGIVETDGLLGNALFCDEYTIIIDLRENRFGILRNQLDGAP